MPIFISILTLFVWIIVILSLIIQLKKPGKKRIFTLSAIIFSCGLIYLLCFYFPHNNLFPPQKYAPIIVEPICQTSNDISKSNEDISLEVLQHCNQIYASRSALKTIFNQISAQDGYIYFSEKGNDKAKNHIGFSYNSKNNFIRKGGIVYYTWNDVDLYTVLNCKE